jgi:predicted membrane-bound mannosyltransferase
MNRSFSSRLEESVVIYQILFVLALPFLLYFSRYYRHLYQVAFIGSIILAIFMVRDIGRDIVRKPL